MKHHFWKFALLFCVPLALYFYIAERNSWRPKTVFVGAGFSVFQVAFSHDGERLVVACDNPMMAQADKVMCLRPANRKLLWSFTSHNGELGSIAFLPDSHDVASLYWAVSRTKQQPNSRNVIRFHVGDSGILQRTLDVGSSVYGEWASYLCCWPNKNSFFHQELNDSYLTDLMSGRTKKLHFKVTQPYSKLSNQLALSPDGRTLAARVFSPSSQAPRIGLFDLSSRKVRLWLESRDEDGQQVLAFSPDSRFVASDSITITTNSQNYRVKLWDVRNAKMRCLLRAQDQVMAFTFSPDNQILAAADASGLICLWSTTSGQLLRTLNHSKDTIFTLAFSPDGGTLASGSADGTVKLWRIK